MLGGQRKLFEEFTPYLWTRGKETVYSIRRDHGLETEYLLHNPSDPINRGKDPHEQVLIEYLIKGKKKERHSLATMADLDSLKTEFYLNGKEGLRGDLGERISRRIVKHLLRHYRQGGRMRETFDIHFKNTKKPGEIVTQNEKHYLQVYKYPNIRLYQRAEGQDICIAEYDGLFDYRRSKRRRIFILESKTGEIDLDTTGVKKGSRGQLQINTHDLVHKLLPLRELNPKTPLIYILFAHKEDIYNQHLTSWKHLGPEAIKVYETLSKQDISTMFFTFNETKQQFNHMTEFMIEQFKIAKGIPVKIRGDIEFGTETIKIYDGGQTPRVILVQDPNDPSIMRKVLPEDLEKIITSAA